MARSTAPNSALKQVEYQRAPRDWPVGGLVTAMLLLGLAFLAYALLELGSRTLLPGKLLGAGALPGMIVAAVVVTWFCRNVQWAGSNQGFSTAVWVITAAIGGALFTAGAALLVNYHLGAKEVTQTSHPIEAKQPNRLRNCAQGWYISTVDGESFNAPLGIGNLVKAGDSLTVARRRGVFGFDVVETFSNGTVVEPARAALNRYAECTPG